MNLRRGWNDCPSPTTQVCVRALISEQGHARRRDLPAFSVCAVRIAFSLSFHELAELVTTASAAAHAARKQMRRALFWRGYACNDTAGKT